MGRQKKISGKGMEGIIYESEERKYKRMYLGRIHIDKIVTKEQFENREYKVEEENV